MIAFAKMRGFWQTSAPMKKLATIFTLVLAAAAARAALPQPDLIAQIHFAGAQKISADPNSAAFTNEFCSAEAQALARQTLDKLARVPGAWFKSKLATGAGDGAAQLRPLLDDFLKSEWVFEARDTTNGAPEFALAIRLDDDRAQLWSKNLAAVLQDWTRIGIVQDKPGIWVLKKHLPPNLVEFSRRDGWVLINCGQNKLSLREKIAGRLLAAGAKSSEEPGWLNVDANWPRLAQWFPKLKGLGLPETRFQVTAADANLHIDGKCFFPENLSLNLEPWRMPTNTVHQPFVSFTAVRGFSGWLKSQPWAQPGQITPAPDQLFVWALPQIPYQTFAAVPVADAADALGQVFTRLQPVVNSPGTAENFFTPFSLVRTNSEVLLQGVPFVSPSLKAIREPAGQFLLAGAFPNTPRSKPLPAELFQRLATKNLVFYHWEITAERLPQALNLSQLGLVLTSHHQLGGDSAALKWILKIAPSLGNTVTEITQTAPDQFTFARKAPGGLTAVELLALGNWLEAPNFPGCDLKLPPRPKNPRRPNPAPPGMPAPVPAK